MKIDQLMMFGMQFFVNFERKVLIIFIKGIENKIFDFKWILNGPLKMLFLYVTP